jgi:hypothetical protein
MKKIAQLSIVVLALLATSYFDSTQSFVSAAEVEDLGEVSNQEAEPSQPKRPKLTPEEIEQKKQQKKA